MASKKLSEIVETVLEDNSQFYTQLSGITGKTDLSSLALAVSGYINLEPSDPTIVTYENLNANGDVGQIASTVAAGNDTRFLTNDEAAAVAAGDLPSAANPIITQSALTSTTADISGQFLLIQGSMRDTEFPGTYVDSTKLSNNAGSCNCTIYSSGLNGGNGGTSSVWSDVFPISIPTGTKRTIITGSSAASYGSSSSDDENWGKISIDINWDSTRVNGYYMGVFGKDLTEMSCYRFIGTTNSEVTGIIQNGVARGAGPVIGTTTNSITKLPVWYSLMNFGFTLEHRSF